MKDLCDKINSKDYDFLRENKELQNISYLVISGSYGYGTNNEGSDIDLRGALREDKKYLYGLESFEQFEDRESDTVIYSLKKFVKLCRQSNPNTIELLGVEEDCIVQMDEIGKSLRENQEMFLSKKAIKTFGNYSNDQLRRLQNALCHDEFEDSDKAGHMKRSMDNQIENFNANYKNFDKNAISISINEHNDLCLDINLKAYPIKDFAIIYTELSNTIKSYNKLNKRNNKKTEKQLYKHAMHMIRLTLTGTDILNGKGIVTRRRDEHQLLMDIRNGIYSFQEIFDINRELFRKFDEAAKNTKLPDDVNHEIIDDFLIKAYSDKL